MNDTSASRAEHEARTTATVRILVWDAPVRVFHWLMVASFAGAWLTAESERWRLLHVTLGYTMVGLVGFRVIWGLMGTRYARFSTFVRSPAAVVRYLTSLLKHQPERYVGHNPAGAIAILAMLLMTLAIGSTGWAVYNGAGGEWFEELHEGVANAMLALVALHVAAVLGSSVVHRENLVRPMITGYKSGETNEGVRSARWGVAALLVAGVIAWWWTQWQSAPQAPASNSSTGAVTDRRTNADRDD
ncbi:cytochrome B [Trinickia dabaoshanensis]|uniref:Cytochrome B n=1 Tax=Trinickia dabaoshanensis TaxID=564714 RepID=A0A2N7VVF5_9BURK|nr:cytochrome b/b6 domain-containing protein [Trinickia dabaoshanensis]PMS21119.1 cytochrome B [Trinickia dabaoshanensis]